LCKALKKGEIPPENLKRLSNNPVESNKSLSLGGAGQSSLPWREGLREGKYVIG
jgi:hypothetical protein